MLSNNKILEIETKTSLIYQSLKKDIIKGNFRPGEKLVAARLASHFGVSTIPIREAFNQLLAEGFLENIPHTGVYVQEIDFDCLRQIFLVRGILEGYAIRAACPYLTKKEFKKLNDLTRKIEKLIKNESFSQLAGCNYDFHMTIYKATNNDCLIKIIDDLIDNASRVRGLYDSMQQRAVNINIEHGQIIEALENHNAEKAETLMQAHISNTLNYMLKKM